ncbi:zinc ribbon domain-containing protein [Gordonia sp. TBRC 11910]|uniref:Zinc ribbon domain-containing protein n=1 Tax=Gordonia asplenii TaxID=2725283 RepID=A0A848L4H6_9ACTN|nr:FmdB family zinc ribbon protein [Gordonia asplenii]NMO03491.1 zinc ribbon domain-containing protein [Gordonia asplenii]
MPLYRFECPSCGTFDAGFAMADVPDTLDCRCGEPARRRITAPRLARGGRGMRLLDATKATAERPGVVNAVPDARRESASSSNPLHAKLPRP